MAANDGDVSDAMSENEYEEDSLHFLREDDSKDDIDIDLDDPHHNRNQSHDHYRNHSYSHKSDADVSMDKSTSSKAARAGPGGTEVKKKYDPKDPLRPRRKKARRACYACQRAHLTCGDERPCQRCIKRGLADGCQDGVRKKAKYLHDAPPEALRPVLGPNFNATTTAAATAASITTTAATTAGNSVSRSNGHRHPSSAGSDVSASNVTSYYAPSSAPPFGVFSSSAQTPTATLPENLTFPAPQSPVSPTFVPSTGDGAATAAQLSQMGLTATTPSMASFSPALFDPSNPSLFNFDLDGINFGSQYAAMEFGMLGHMSSGAGEAHNDPSSLSRQGSTLGGNGVGFGATDVFGNGTDGALYDGSSGGLLNDFLTLDSAANGFYPQGSLQPGLPHAYAIAAAPPSLQSPSTDNNSPQPTSYTFDGSPTTNAYGLLNGANSNGQAMLGRPSVSAMASSQQQQQQQQQQLQQQHQQQKAKATAGKLLPQSILGKRHRDPSSVYDTVKEPYMYVNGFHRLIALLQRRFSANRILRIAKALSSIRPSFISCTRTLNRQDLIFMEKCFQRTLIEYEEFMSQASSPTIVCRRTGEVAAVNKEFTALTGWTKEVLLGKEPNLNVNTGSATRTAGDGAVGSSNGSLAPGSSRGPVGLSTPRMRALNADFIKASEGKQQPLFIAELMDDDNVIEFYEDFAHLAFGDSRGSVTRKCRLLKYRTREMLDASGSGSGTGSAPNGSAASNSAADEFQIKGGSSSATAPSSAGSGSRQGPPATSGILSSRVARIDGEHGTSKIEKDGKLECAYCWHIRRDTFDIPMMIVMNFLPCYYPNQEPHQLAV